MTIGAVLFDAAETLFTTRGSVGEIYGHVAREFGCTAPFDEIQRAFARQFRNSGPLSTSEEKSWWRNVVYRVFADVGMVRDFNRFFEKVYDQFRDSRGWMLFPETREVMDTLKKNGIRLGVISNFDSRIYSVMKDLGIDSYFDSVTISSETGFAKPDPEIFGIAARALGVPAGQILMVGDNLTDDVMAARQAGLQSILVDRASRYRDTGDVVRVPDLRAILPIVQN